MTLTQPNIPDLPSKVDAMVESDLPKTQQRQMEDQLATIIISARNVAIAAEELLREVSQAGEGVIGRSTPHAIAVAPRLLAATEQQLLSVTAMLRKS
jgi:predicted amino acid dehydrogenase